MFKGRTRCDTGRGLLEGNRVRKTPGWCGGNRFNWCSKLCFPPVVYKMPNCARSHTIICNCKHQDFNSGLKWWSLTCSYIAVCSLRGLLKVSHIKTTEIHVTVIKWGLNQIEMACPKSHTEDILNAWVREVHLRWKCAKIQRTYSSWVWTLHTLGKGIISDVTEVA